THFVYSGVGCNLIRHFTIVFKYLKLNNMKKQLLLTAITLFFLTGCNNNKTERETIPDIKEPTVMESKEERNKQIALQCINAWDSGNIDEIVQHLASNTVDYGDGSTPPARGIEAMKSFMELWRFSVEE